MALIEPSSKSLDKETETSRIAGEQPESESSLKEEEGELEKLESEVKQMAMKIVEYRATLPDHFNSLLASIFSSQRPLLPDFHSRSDPGPSAKPNPGAESMIESSIPAPVKDPKTAQKVCLLKEKISSNLSAVPVVIQRMKECISRIDYLDADNGIIHPAFKRRRAN